jgi:hypothetical protein
VPLSVFVMLAAAAGGVAIVVCALPTLDRYLTW